MALTGDKVGNEMTSTENERGAFICVNCGSRISELFRRYSPTVLKLMHCNVCRAIADKYLEYDPVVVIIDLVLLNEYAVRHVLYNMQFKIHWKLAVVLVLIEACLDWVHQKTMPAVESAVKQPFDIFEGEKNFYFMCLKTVASSAALFAFMLIVTSLRWYMHPDARPSDYTTLLLWKGTVLSGCGNLLMIPSFIWGEIGSGLHPYFIFGYTFVSLLKIYAVVTGTSKLVAAAVVFCALILKYYVNLLVHVLQYYM